VQATEQTTEVARPISLGECLRRVSDRVRTFLAGPSPTPAPHLHLALPNAPRRIGRWRVIGMVGEGTSSIVYRVVLQSGTATPYALKLHDQVQASDRMARDRFRREMRILRSIHHRNVVGLIDTGEYEGRQYIVMELVEGRNLREAEEQLHPHLRRKLDWSIQIARALAALHDSGIVHRDLKPENILTTRIGVIKLVDFGLARHSDSTVVTQVGFLVGTPAYMAPEYLRGQTPDSRSDLYSLGVVLYELFTGRMPYNAVTLHDFIEAHLDEAPIPPHHRVPSLPRSLEAVILRLLEKKPARRFQKADDLRLALERVLSEVIGLDADADRNVA
jgi:serine/threonine-protein kinase